MVRRQVASGQRNLTLAQKVKIIQEYDRQCEINPTTSYYTIGKVFKIQGGQVSRYIRNRAAIMQHAKSTPGNMTTHSGRSCVKQDVETAVLQYFNELRTEDIAVSTRMLVLFALSVDPNFHGGDFKRLEKSWVYQFLQRHNLSIRKPTRESQKQNRHLTEIAEDFADGVSERFLPFGTLADVPLDYFVNMDETPVYFEERAKTTIAKKGAKTVNARSCSSTNPRVTVCLAVTASGKKLPPFVVFKGQPGARIETNE
jgi:hypothetical protein